MTFGVLGNLISGQTPSQVDMNGPVGWGLSGASMIPGPLGILGSLAKGGVRLNNASYADTARPSWGQQGLDFGQYLGATLGFNSYGQGGGNDRLGDFRGVAVTPSGMVTDGGFLGIGGETTGAYTPGEAQKRAAAAKYGSSFGVPAQSPMAPTAAPAPQPAGPMPPAPSPAMPSVSPLGTPTASMAAPQADPFDREGIARVLRDAGFGGGGGGRSGGGGDTRSGNGGGGRSDRSSMSSGRG